MSEVLVSNDDCEEFYVLLDELQDEDHSPKAQISTIACLETSLRKITLLIETAILFCTNNTNNEDNNNNNQCTDSCPDLYLVELEIAPKDPEDCTVYRVTGDPSKPSNFLFVVYNICSRESFDQARDKLNFLRSMLVYRSHGVTSLNSRTLPEQQEECASLPKLVLIGNSSLPPDLAAKFRVVTEEEGRGLAQEFGCVVYLQSHVPCLDNP